VLSLSVIPNDELHRRSALSEILSIDAVFIEHATSCFLNKVNICYFRERQSPLLLGSFDRLASQAKYILPQHDSETCHVSR
jgi:hypothetical protein